MVVAKKWQAALRALIAGALALPLAAGALAAQTPASPVQPAAVSYSAISDEDLTRIAARWDGLGPQQRRALLSEMKLRMKRSTSAEDALQIKVRRRFGTVVRHRNGATARLRIEVRSTQPGRDFGVGFEKRSQQDGVAPEIPDSEKPVIRVADPE